MIYLWEKGHHQQHLHILFIVKNNLKYVNTGEVFYTFYFKFMSQREASSYLFTLLLISEFDFIIRCRKYLLTLI